MQRALPRNTGAHTPPSDDDADHMGPLEAILSILWVLTPLTATVSVLVVLVAILTNQWLHTEEKMNNPSYNGTGEKDYLSKMTVSGLWMLCFTNPGETIYECNRIDYFTKEEYSPDPNDSTLAIPYAVTRSAAFFATATILLCSGYCCSIIGQCARHKGLYTFISGIVFIVTGLVMLFGLIMYISIFKSEVGGKLRPRSQLLSPAFEYSYGYSFILYVCGFISTQFAGITAIFLFIYKSQYDFLRKHHQQQGMKPPMTPPPPSLNYTHHLDHTTFYPCRRHPQAYINSNSAIHYAFPAAHQKRYFFGKELQQQQESCSLHQEVMDATANFYDFPPPPTISYQFEERPVPFGRSSFPRDITSNTMSTTADVNCEEFGVLPEGGCYDDYSPSIQHEHEFVTFDLDQPLPLRAAQSSLSISSGRGVGGGGDTLRRTTPV